MPKGAFDAETARNVYRRLHDVDFFLSRVRVLLRQGNYDDAWPATAAAISTKLDAIRRFPHAESELDDMGVDFEELYDVEWKKALGWFAVVMIVSRVGLPLLPDLESSLRNLEDVKRELQRMQKEYWPENTPCGRRLKEVITCLEQFIQLARALPPDAKRITEKKDELRELQTKWIDCLYPKQRMYDIINDLVLMDLYLIEVYSALKHRTPIFPDLRFDPVTILRFLDEIERWKHGILARLKAQFPNADEGTGGTDWTPAPDPPPPWPEGVRPV